jgi:hypothetical protein
MGVSPERRHTQTGDVLLERVVRLLRTGSSLRGVVLTFYGRAAGDISAVLKRVLTFGRSGKYLTTTTSLPHLRCTGESRSMRNTVVKLLPRIIPSLFYLGKKSEAVRRLDEFGRQYRSIPTTPQIRSLVSLVCCRSPRVLCRPSGTWAVRNANKTTSSV